MGGRRVGPAEVPSPNTQRANGREPEGSVPTVHRRGEQQMTASVEQQIAAPVATVPGGGGAGLLDPLWRRTGVGALQGRVAVLCDQEGGGSGSVEGLREGRRVA